MKERAEAPLQEASARTALRFPWVGGVVQLRPESTSLTRKRLFVLAGVVSVLLVAMACGWLAATRIESPADAAARTAAPTPSPILVPVESRVLSSKIVTRGTVRFGLPRPVSIAPSILKVEPGLITTLPVRNAQIAEGGILLTASGRPVFALQGQIPSYRDLAPGVSGDDVLQLEQGLDRLGFHPGLVDRTYDQSTSAAVAKWYTKSGWEPFGPTIEQRDKVRTLERELGEAMKMKLSAEAAAAAAALAVESARATADHGNRVAAAELKIRVADGARLMATAEHGTPLAIESERAKAEYADTAAEADLAAAIADRALVVLDPRQPEAARTAAEAKLDLARAAALKTRLESTLAIQAAERDAQLAVDQIEAAEAALRAAHLAGETAVQAAVDAEKIAKLDVELTTKQADRLATELEAAKKRLGVQVPVDEIVFVPMLPVRVEEVVAKVGDPARGSLLAVTDNQLAIDSSVPLEEAPLLKPGMPVAIDEEALGIRATGSVRMVAATPGTRGVDGYHFYFEAAVDETPTPLEGFSVRLTIPIESTHGAVTAVPLSAVSLAADGTSRVQVAREGALEYVLVQPGLAADGFVEVSPVGGTLAPGDLVVIGYKGAETIHDSR